MKAFDISRRFVEYYQVLGFEELPRSSLLDPSIPMTFVMSAGLVQIETCLEELGREGRDSYVLSQTCFRHFDLSQVGDSPVHLSLFEMPGAFTFNPGDKGTTIRHMWDLITAVLGIDASKLWVTYFAGGTKVGCSFPPDTETLLAWRAIGLPEWRIVPLGPKDNFWMQGGGIDGHEPRRKCGPNSEVFFDRGSELACGPDCRPGCRCGRFIEFANSLFIFAEVDEETQHSACMERPFYETVIGTERVAMILQGKPSVFEIDCMAPLMEEVRSWCPASRSGEYYERSRQVLCDYARALLFLAADGAPSPGKGGRKRIVKLLIRGFLAQQRVLRITSPAFLPNLLGTIVQVYGGQCPGLAAAQDTLLSYFTSQAASFERTLQKGIRHLNRELERASGFLGSAQVVDLVKNWGIPLTLVKSELRERGLEFDGQAYQSALARWKQTQG